MTDRTDPVHFPGLQYLQLIRQRLWNGREVGRAAVIIGAGFSRNAEPRSTTAKPFPLWGDLATALGGPLGLTAEWAKSKPMTRLGSEFETSFGRQALDDLLSQTIPWQHHGPGKVHRLLLNLPWADIFTTNYDTLLEDARADIIDRKYDLVLSPPDISSQQRPRIVKLHGSFPSHRPFIFTEEDFRQYPQASSSFVNLVQQSIMENALLLLGFSGDDPNFLNWAGWVRDRLGPSAPAIYLCGLLNHSDTARDYFHGRGIRTIDLAPLFPASQWPNQDERNSRALEWLLLSLANGQTPHARDWPQPPRPPQLPQSSPGLPPIWPPEPSRTWELFTSLTSTPADIFKQWHTAHAAYPGWQVCPPDKRQLLWSSGHDALHDLLAALPNLSAPHDLLLAHACMTRLDLCLMPLFKDVADLIRQVVERYRPFLEMTRRDDQLGPGAPLPIGEEWRVDPRQPDLSWDSIQRMWMELTLSLMEEARHQQDAEAFHQWRDLLTTTVRYNSAWIARWHCEQALFALGRLDAAEVKVQLAAWPESTVTPYWESRRAAILVELGLLDEAERVVTAALAAIRARLTTAKEDLELLTQEGWTLNLVDTIRFARRDHLSGEWPKSERLDVLSGLGADVLETLDGTAQRALASRWRPAHVEKEVRGFDPGRVIHQSHLNNDPFADLLHAFGLLRTMERGAVPLRCGDVVLRADGVTKACETLFPFAPLEAISTLIRQNAKEAKDAVETLFSRTAVVRLPSEAVQALFDLLITSTQAAERELAGDIRGVRVRRDSLAHNQLDQGLELLTRLAFRLDTPQANQALNLAIQFYQSPVFTADSRRYERLANLFDRVLWALPPQERLKRTGDLLELPIWDERGFASAGSVQAHNWPEPLRPSALWREMPGALEVRSRSWTRRIKELIAFIREGTPAQRRVAALRMTSLYRLGVLNEREAQRFGQAMWSKVGPAGLPTGTGLHDHMFLTLPSPEPQQALRLLKQHFLQTPLPLTFRVEADPDHGTVLTPEGQAGHLFTSIWYASAKPGEVASERLIHWSEEEAISLFHAMMQWWDSQKQFVPLYQQSAFFRLVHSDARHLLLIVGVVLLPAIRSRAPEVDAELQRLIQETSDLGVLTAELQGQAYLYGGRFYEAEQWYWQALLSNEPARVQGAVSGIFRWRLMDDRAAYLTESRLMDHVVDRVVFRILPGLAALLQALAYLMQHAPDAVSEEQTQRILQGLWWLERETRIPEPQDEPISRATIPDDEKPELRAAASALAAQLYQRYKDEPLLALWAEMGQKDSLPEVRDPWWQHKQSDAETHNN